MRHGDAFFVTSCFSTFFSFSGSTSSVIEAGTRSSIEFTKCSRSLQFRRLLLRYWEPSFLTCQLLPEGDWPRADINWRNISIALSDQRSKLVIARFRQLIH